MVETGDWMASGRIQRRHLIEDDTRNTMQCSGWLKVDEGGTATMMTGTEDNERRRDTLMTGKQQGGKESNEETSGHALTRKDGQQAHQIRSGRRANVRLSDHNENGDAKTLG